MQFLLVDLCILLYTNWKSIKLTDAILVRIYAPMHMMALTVCIQIGNVLLPDGILFVIYAHMHMMVRTVC